VWPGHYALVQRDLSRPFELLLLAVVCPQSQSVCGEVDGHADGGKGGGGLGQREGP